MKRARVFSGSKAAAPNQGAAGNFPAIIGPPSHAGGQAWEWRGGHAGGVHFDCPAGAVDISLEVVKDP